MPGKAKPHATSTKGHAKGGSKKKATHGKSATSSSSKKKPAGPIEHVIVLMMENRAFDHIFGYRQGVNGLKGNESNLLDPSKSESSSNPAYAVSNGAPYAVLAGEGPGHSFNAACVQLCNSKNGPGTANPAKNNGFVSKYQTGVVYAVQVKN